MPPRRSRNCSRVSDWSICVRRASICFCKASMPALPDAGSVFRAGCRIARGASDRTDTAARPDAVRPPAGCRAIRRRGQRKLAAWPPRAFRAAGDNRSSLGPRSVNLPLSSVFVRPNSRPAGSRAITSIPFAGNIAAEVCAARDRRSVGPERRGSACGRRPVRGRAIVKLYRMRLEMARSIPAEGQAREERPR